MGCPWDAHGLPMGYPQVSTHGPSMGNPWATPVGCARLLPKPHGMPMNDIWRPKWLPVGYSRTTHGQPMGNPWATRGITRVTNGEPMGYLRATHGRSVSYPRATRGLPRSNLRGLPTGSPRATHRHPMGCPCATHGQPMGNPGAIHGLPTGNPRATHE